ncbi:MAG: ribosome maturation factor RimM [Oscillospiraceae bacterium]|nr:ribosome maturation factor RimM [Oscillospiraceae bacterium]
MIKPYLEAGQIVGTHGIKGELRVYPWCDSPEFLKNFEYLYFNENGREKIKVLSARPHGNIVILSLEGVDTVNAAASLRNKILYIDRDDAELPDGSWFVSDLLSCGVIDADSGKLYGKITDSAKTGANDVWHIKNDAGKEYLIPVIPQVVIKADLENGKVYIRPLKGIFDEN